MAALSVTKRFLQCGGLALKLICRYLRRHGEGELLLHDVLRRSDVLRVMHRDDVSVCVRDVNSRESKAHTFHRVQLFHVARQALAEPHDVTREIGRHIFEIGVMLLRDDQCVACAHRLNIQEGEHAIIFKEDVGRDLVLGDPAEQAVFGHVMPLRFKVEEGVAVQLRTAMPIKYPELHLPGA